MYVYASTCGDLVYLPMTSNRYKINKFALGKKVNLLFTIHITPSIETSYLQLEMYHNHFQKSVLYCCMPFEWQIVSGYLTLELLV